MPRAQPNTARRRVYWWSPEIARLRQACVTARRQWSRFRRRRSPSRRCGSERGGAVRGLQGCQEDPSGSDKRAKSEARREMLETL
ncbi:unnamed protein product [Arctia plantaginis]|uniref:Uncharacterized protein n=1 Tax=Arctia plantaginis TaxID=874455 RepID=A0A8S1BPY1_ARCPL|nr:unnamed protein product [Arctia plantaginis]